MCQYLGSKCVIFRGCISQCNYLWRRRSSVSGMDRAIGEWYHSGITASISFDNDFSRLRHSVRVIPWIFCWWSQEVISCIEYSCFVLAISNHLYWSRSYSLAQQSGESRVGTLKQSVLCVTSLPKPCFHGLPFYSSFWISKFTHWLPFCFLVPSSMNILKYRDMLNSWHWWLFSLEIFRVLDLKCSPTDPVFCCAAATEIM